MANIYDDFDKRREHSRRFEETRLGGQGPVYSAPKKARPAPKEHRFHSERQDGLLDALLEFAGRSSGRSRTAAPPFPGKK